MLFNSNTTGVTHGAVIGKPSGAHEFTFDFSGVLVTRSLVFCVVCFRSLLVRFYFWSLLFLSLFDLWFLIAPLISSNYHIFSNLLYTIISQNNIQTEVSFPTYL